MREELTLIHTGRWGGSPKKPLITMISHGIPKSQDENGQIKGRQKIPKRLRQFHTGTPLSSK
jgi:hypothetical protein